MLPSDSWGHLGSAEPGRGNVSCWLSGGAVGNNMFGLKEVNVKVMKVEINDGLVWKEAASAVGLDWCGLTVKSVLNKQRVSEAQKTSSLTIFNERILSLFDGAR